MKILSLKAKAAPMPFYIFLFFTKNKCGGFSFNYPIARSKLNKILRFGGLAQVVKSKLIK